MRECGMLLPIASLPSRYGIGAFSKEAYDFIDKLKAAGQQYWQILPFSFWTKQLPLSTPKPSS